MIMWTYHIDRHNGIDVMCDGALYGSCVPKPESSNLQNAMRSVQYLYDLGNAILQSPETPHDSVVSLIRMITSASAHLIPP